MGFFKKILIQTNEGDVVDITDLNQMQYEAFLQGMAQLNELYYKSLAEQNIKPIIEKYENEDD
jgi:hypothetical protein